MSKRGKAALTVVSQSFVGLGRAQQKALGSPDLPMALIPHPFGTRSRAELKVIAAQCADDIAKLLCEATPSSSSSRVVPPPAPRAKLIEVPADLAAFNKLFIQKRLADGLIAAPPTVQAVQQMLRHTERAPEEVVATIAPGMGAATVEYIAIQAVMAGCYPEYLPVLIAAAEAVGTKAFHLQAIQSTTNPSAVWLIVNGPAARWLEVNSGAGCLGQGTWANATLGRALRLILQNIGGALPGEMDKATQGQPAKYTMCCAEHEHDRARAGGGHRHDRRHHAIPGEQRLHLWRCAICDLVPAARASVSSGGLGQSRSETPPVDCIENARGSLQGQ